MTLQEVKSYLIGLGFKEYPVNANKYADWLLAKPTKSPRHCDCNAKPPQICVFGYGPKHGIGGSIEMDITGELSDVWYKLGSYAIRLDDVPKVFGTIKNNLVTAWESLK